MWMLCRGEFNYFIGAENPDDKLSLTIKMSNENFVLIFYVAHEYIYSFNIVQWAILLASDFLLSHCLDQVFLILFA